MTLIFSLPLLIRRIVDVKKLSCNCDLINLALVNPDGMKRGAMMMMSLVN